jgi:alpha-1,2-mannosyltransferase
MRPLARGDLLALGALAATAFLIRLIPVARGGGLWGEIGYDDGVYFGAAVAMAEGAMPYRDFLLVQPPGEPLVLLPFALLGGWIGDGAAFTIARIATMAVGGLSCVLAALICGRSSRLAGIAAGLVYATWRAAALGDRTTDLHGPQTVLLLAALLVLGRSGRVRPRRALLVGILIGLAASVQLWQGLSAVVLLWWIAVRAPRAGQRLADGWRSVAAYVAGAAGAFAVVCAPFVLASPWNAVRHTLIDQLGRPDMRIGLSERLADIVSAPTADQLPAAVRGLAPAPWIAVPEALLVAAIVIVTGYRHPRARLWALLAGVQTMLILLTPSFFGDYATFAAPAASLVIGTGIAAIVAPLIRRGPSTSTARQLVHGLAISVAIFAILGQLAFSLGSRSGSRVQTRALAAIIEGARCVSSDSPTLLILTGALRRSLRKGCPVVVDPTGIRYDTDRRLAPGSAGMRLAPGYQAAMQAWYGTSDAALFGRSRAGFTAETWRLIEANLPVERTVGDVLVRLAKR